MCYGSFPRRFAPSFRRRLLAPLTLCLLLAFAIAARADEPERRAEIVQTLARGESALQRGDARAALETFDAAAARDKNDVEVLAWRGDGGAGRQGGEPA